MTKIDKIQFDTAELDIYGSLENPYFIAADVAEILGYADNRTDEMIKSLEHDEYVKAAIDRKGQTRNMIVLTELGLYNILSQSRKPTARLWRRVVHQQLVENRRKRSMSIVDQFDEWDDLLDALFIDPETGILMQSVTVPGGDVEQVPYEE